MYLPCIEAAICQDNRSKRFKHPLNHPVTIVKWNGIVYRFISWLNKSQKSRFRLPTEAEWEYASRSGTTTIYSWSNTPDGKYANGSNKQGWPEDRYSNISPVMSYISNQFGLYDMQGNVFEWVQDCWNAREYEYKPTTEKANEARGEKYNHSGICKRRLVRGGSMWQHPKYLRSSSRYRLFANSGFIDVGFRLVKD
ncbi:formylglycine-generating enzyme family protein [Pseudoalteromonas ardens]|uniref:formylglycine-generating enzyme family protein n=1 Tax=Pseudoalteromonas ardens TaxID=3048490 RepID=UPI0009E5708E|nr:formylglycine-generating enzyme family protein [Pseudoalteromonas sp. R96]MDK1310999.1 formylglycine-generating enzyme family protein [Pseudoalteromonas sp. R96]